MAFGTPPFTTHIDGQDGKSAMGVVGTLGTADTGGTAQILPFGVNPLTGAAYADEIGTSVKQVNIVGGTINAGTVTSSLAINSGTLSTLGTVGSVTNIGILNAGTVVNNGGSVSIQGLQANAALAVGNPFPTGGTDSGGTVRSILVNSSGQQTTNLTSSGTLLNLATGTLAVVTTISNVTNGSFVQTVGTLTTGTLQNLVSGTINALASGTISTGTFAMTAGTLSPIPTITQATFGSHGTTGVSIFGTLAGGTSSGAGTEIFVTSVSLTIPSTAGSQDVSIGFGTNGGTFHAGTGLLVRGNFPAGGGIAKSYDPPINSGTNAQVTVFQAGAGTIDVNITFFTAASTL